MVSKNGNLLMNFPQRGDGSLYPGVRGRARRAGQMDADQWRGDLRHASLDHVRRGAPVIAPKGMNEPMAPMTWQDVRFTTKGDVLYVIVCGIPQGPVQIKSLANWAGQCLGRTAWQP